MWGNLVYFEAVSYVSKLAKPVVEVVQSGMVAQDVLHQPHGPLRSLGCLMSTWEPMGAPMGLEGSLGAPRGPHVFLCVPKNAK